MLPSARTAVPLVVLLAALAAVAVVQAGAGEPETDRSIPLSDRNYLLGDDLPAYERFMMSGGPPPDGIPSIDRPRFISAAEADLDPGDPVIGFVHEGEARAYPHNIMVLHEIVNDRVAGLNVAITYCPLTATAQGFERGGTTLGVSGQLLNSNLVMFDRETGSLFPQIAATAIRGEHRGRTLREVDLVWTTWERWRVKHPGTRVLSERTGHLRNYSRDPYGSYNPPAGYYRRASTIFPLMHESDRHHPKAMVVGARTAERAAHFLLEELARERVQRTEIFVAVYDPELDTGHIYLRGDSDIEIRPGPRGRYRVGERTVRADALPLEKPVPVEAFHFAWHAFYPGSETP